MRVAALPVFILALVAILPAQQFDESQVRKGLSAIKPAETIKSVKKLAADALAGRNAGYPGCWTAAEWIAEQFGNIELVPIGEQDSYFQTFAFDARRREPASGGTAQGKKERKKGKGQVKPPHHETPTTRNVVALLEGSDPKLKDEVVILGGHYDHVGREGQWNAGSRRGKATRRDDVWNGADDNASGTAVVIEVARAFVASGIRPKRSILFILFSAEEHGLCGSKWYCAHPLLPLESTVAMLNFDMVGYTKKKSIDIVGVNHASGQILRTAFLQASRRVRGLKVDLKPWARSGGSDHAPFIEARVPAVFFSSGLHSDYHTVEDEPNMVSGTRMAAVARVGFLGALELAQLPERPAFVPASKDAGGAAMLGLGIDGQLGRTAAKELGLKSNQGGIEVEKVYAMTPAAEAGVESGDVIIGIGRQMIERGKEIESLDAVVRKLEPGQRFSIRVSREGKRKTLKGRMPR